MTGVSLEISGKAAVNQKAASSSSLEITGKAAVASNRNDGTSLEVIGKAAVQTNTGSLEVIGKASVQNDTGSTSLELIQKASVRNSEGKYATRAHMVHFSWTNACLVSTGITCCCALLFVRFLVLWQQCLMNSGASAWVMVQTSVVLGTEVGLFVMAILLILLVPRMIVTWTTAVVFDYMLGVVVSGKIRRQKIVRDGTKVAKEISWMTLTSVFEEGNAVAAAVLLVGFTTTAVLRQMLTVV